MEIAEDTVILTRETADAYRKLILVGVGGEAEPKPGDEETPTATPKAGDDKPTQTTSGSEVGGQTGQTDFFRKLTWTGAVPPQKWMNFYTKVLAKYATDNSLTLKVTFDSNPDAGISKERADETKSALR